MDAFEVNFDGLVGPTHNYAGLSYGNIASMSHQAQVSSPREAALQGLRKAKALADLGLKQGLLPPQARPAPEALRRLGFSGDDSAVLLKASKEAPELLAACSSASSMWTANAATVAPSADTTDGKVHFTAANMVETFHRSIESETTTKTLRAIFADAKFFAHHEPLPPSSTLGDEGAANHSRFCKTYGSKGIELFVYGRKSLASGTSPEPRRFPARQTLEASEAIARLHRLRPEDVFYVQQDPGTIDSGAFHNDVVSVANRDVFFCHEKAFLGGADALSPLKKRYVAENKSELRVIEVPDSAVSLSDAVKSYLFNSQLLSMPDSSSSSAAKMTLIAPQECAETPSVAAYLKNLLADSSSPIGAIKYFDLKQSMRNGGGPACLRLRVVLNQKELAATNQGAILTPTLFAKLVSWAEKHYRDRLAIADLADPDLLKESQTALDELTQIMALGSIYPFQG